MATTSRKALSIQQVQQHLAGEEAAVGERAGREHGHEEQHRHPARQRLRASLGANFMPPPAASSASCAARATAPGTPPEHHHRLDDQVDLGRHAQRVDAGRQRLDDQRAEHAAARAEAPTQQLEVPPSSIDGEDRVELEQLPLLPSALFTRSS